MQFPYPPMMSMVQPPFGNFGPGGRTGMAPPLYVGDLDENIHEEYLHDFFSKFGPLYFVRIMKDKNTGKSRGFGYVNFVNPRDADTAKHQAQYAKLGRKYIRIAFKSDEFKDLPDEGNIFVKNIDPHVTPRDLHNHFVPAGNVVSAKIALDKKGDSLGYGYVQFEKKEHAEAAMNSLQGSKLKENELQLESFLSKEKRPDETLKRSLYVKDLPLDKSEDELKALVDKLFSKFGEIENSFVRKHSEDKHSAFVCFVDQDAAQKAYDEFTSNPVTPEGSDKPIYVNWHQDRSERARQMRQEHYGHGRDNANLYIRNIKSEVTENQVKETFEKFGAVKSVALKPWESAENKNQAKQGFISFSNADDARRAQAEGITDSDIQKLYIEDAPYITMHQSRDNRDNFLNSKKIRKMHNNFMGDQGMRQMPYQMPGRGFQPFPMMPMMTPQQLQNQMRGQYRPQRGGYNRPQQGGYQKPQSRQQHNNNYHSNQNNNRGGYGGQQQQQHQHQQQRRDLNKVDNRQQGNVKGNTQNQEPKITDSGITVQTLKNKVGEFLQLDINKQRQILGELLFPLIKPLASDLAPKITGMLIDLSVLELSEILEFLEDPELLRERVFEARDLILEGERQ